MHSHIPGLDPGFERAKKSLDLLELLSRAILLQRLIERGKLVQELSTAGHIERLPLPIAWDRSRSDPAAGVLQILRNLLFALVGQLDHESVCLTYGQRAVVELPLVDRRLLGSRHLGRAVAFRPRTALRMLPIALSGQPVAVAPEPITSLDVLPLAVPVG